MTTKKLFFIKTETSHSVSSVIGKTPGSWSYLSSWKSWNSRNVEIRVGGWSQTWSSLIRFIARNSRWF